MSTVPSDSGLFGRCLVLWREDARLWSEVSGMQLPKAVVVPTMEDAHLVVGVYARPMLFSVNDKFVRVHPSGKVEDLTEKVMRAYALVSGSHPLKQGELVNATEASKRAR